VVRGYKEYTASLQEDIKIRQLIDKRLANASVSGVEIERGINHVTVTIHTAKPGIVIGKGGANVEVLRQQIGALTTARSSWRSRRSASRSSTPPRRDEHRRAS
jgi:small subunit ribosomal protein S3